MLDLTGKMLGKYRLVEQLGRGGMAQVYKAYHRRVSGEIISK